MTDKTGYSLIPSWGYIPAAHDIALKRLAGAIIGQAAADARKTDLTGLEARAWLLSPDCAEVCDFIGLDFRAVRIWVNSGCSNWGNRNKTNRLNGDEME